MRSTHDLTGVWRFLPDPTGDGEGRGYPQPTLDTRRWNEVAVPSTFDDCSPALPAYEGKGWFRRTFIADASAAGAYPVLRFEGVNYDADVWLNGVHVGRHEGGFLQFEFSVAGVLCAGENTLVVRADNTRRDGCVPGRQRGWRPFGGILRELALDIRPRVHIARVAIAAKANGDIAARALIGNATAQAARVNATLTITDAAKNSLLTASHGGAEIACGADAWVEFNGHIANVSPWSPDAPMLYTAQVAITGDGIADDVSTEFGFRTIEARDAKLWLNGQTITLRGFNRHEDTPGRGPLPDPAGAERDLRHMKSLGANFVRLCHYPHHPSTLALCDRLGLLVMGEIPLYWWHGNAESVPSGVKLAAARRQLREMIERDINHPSIIFWSVSNETGETRAEVAMGNDELVCLARELDPTRLATHVSDRWSVAPRFSFDSVICINGYPGFNGLTGPDKHKFALSEATAWWRKHLATLHERFPHKPILIAEFGAAGLEHVIEGTTGEQTQLSVLRAEAGAFDEPWISGRTVWCYADHPWPEEPFVNNITISPYGIVTRSRRSKQATGAIREILGAPVHAPIPVMRPEKIEMVGVHMERHHMRDLPEAAFPPGYGIRAMRRNEGAVWEDVQRDAEPYGTISPGTFEASYGEDPAAIERRCFFITAPNGCAVGTMGAWYEHDRKGLDWGRIHWVCTRREYQGKGLARAAMAFAMRELAKHHERAWLVTHPVRVGAIKIYLDFGFLPDMTQPWASEAWAWVRERLDHPALRSQS